MKPTNLFFSLLLFATCCGLAKADDSAADQLPAALQAIGQDDVQLLSEREAHDVRGQWYLNFNLPLLTTSLSGQGNFGANILTLSGGKHAGQPILIRVWVGR